MKFLVVLMCTLVALSAAKHENESKKTKRGILTGSPYNQYGYAQPSLSLGAGQVVQTYAAQPAVLSSYGGQSSLAYRSVAVAPSYGHSYAAQPAVSYAASPVYRSVSVQHVPQVIVREKYPVQVPVHVDSPYAVDRVVNVDNPVPVHVDRPVPFDRPYNVEVPKPYPVHVDKPYPVPVVKNVAQPYAVHVDKPYPVEVVSRVAQPYPVYVQKTVVQTQQPVHVHKTIVSQPIVAAQPVHQYAAHQYAAHQYVSQPAFHGY